MFGHPTQNAIEMLKSSDWIQNFVHAKTFLKSLQKPLKSNHGCCKIVDLNNKYMPHQVKENAQ